MTGRLSKSIAILSAAVVFLALLMFAPAEITRSTGFEVIAGAEGTAHTHTPCGKESCGYSGYNSHNSTPYTPFSKAVFDCLGEDRGFENGTELDLWGYEHVELDEGNYFLDADYTINTDYGIYYYLGNICLNGHTLTINTNGDPAIRTNDITICDCSESNSGMLNTNSGILIDKCDANEESYNYHEIHLFGGKYYGEVRCGELYVYDGANIASAYAVNANVYGGYVGQLSKASYVSCTLYQYSGKVNWTSTSNVNRHYDDNHDGKCECGFDLCNESFWTISKPTADKSTVIAAKGQTAELSVTGGFNSGLNSGSEAYYHISPKYQWYSCDKNGDNKTVIDGATGDKYSFTAAEGESYYVCGVSFDGVEEYSEVITVKVPENPKRYNVTDGTAVDKIREALLDRSDYIELTLTGSALTDITTENYGNKVKELYNSAFTHITEAADINYANRSQLGDYIAKSIGTTGMSAVCYTSDSTVSQVVFSYEPEYYTDKSQEEQVTSRLESIYTELALSELSEQEKVYKIYNWIVNNVSYDYDNLNKDENKTKYTAYGALVDKKAVCQGFSALFYRMCLDNGIDCRIVTGTSKGENHAWNIVKVGEKYYYADSTWDCFVIEDTANGRQAKPGTFFYFLRGTLANHDESEEENVTSAYTGSMAAADAYLSAFKAAVVDGTPTAVHLDGTALSNAEKTWYDVSVTNGDGCKKNVAVKGKSTIVSDNGLANMELYSGETEVHSYTNGKCTCGAFEDGIGAKLAGYTLSLNGNIGVNFYMELSSEIVNSDTAYMQFKLPNGEVTTVKVAEATPTAIGTKTYYVFPCEVAAKEMTDTITAQMFDGSGNPGTEYTYTVREYADYILEHPSEFANSEKTVALVKAMLNYGAYSQTYFGYHTERLANKDIDLALPTIEAANLVDKAPKITNNANVATFISAYLSLKSETAANVKVQVTGTPTVTVNGSSVTLSDCATSGDYYVLTVDNIPANQLDEMYVFTLTSSENTASLEFGALSYCYMALNNPSASDNLKNLCKSIYAYNTAADAYAA